MSIRIDTCLLPMRAEADQLIDRDHHQASVSNVVRPIRPKIETPCRVEHVHVRRVVANHARPTHPHRVVAVARRLRHRQVEGEAHVPRPQDVARARDTDAVCHRIAARDVL